jgi:hypothetical protein
MHPNLINYHDPNSILVINPIGKMRQVFTPFKVQVKEPTTNLDVNSWVLVDLVKASPSYKLMFKIGSKWYPYHLFRITIKF